MNEWLKKLNEAFDAVYEVKKLDEEVLEFIDSKLDEGYNLDDIIEVIVEQEIEEGSIKGSGTDRKAQLKKAYRSGEQDTRQFNRQGGMPTNKPKRGADAGIKKAYSAGRMSDDGGSAAKGAARSKSQDALHGTDKVPDWAKGSKGEKMIRKDMKSYALRTSKPKGKLR